MSEPDPDFPVEQEDDVIAGRHLTVIGLAAVVVGAAGVLIAATIVRAELGTIRPTAAGPKGMKPAPTAIARIAQTPIWETEEGIQLRNHQREELGTLRWENKDGRMAQIPIDRAIDLVVEENQ
jgi:hypothetical protein